MHASRNTAIQVQLIISPKLLCIRRRERRNIQGAILHGNFRGEATRARILPPVKHRSKLSILRTAMKVSTAQFKVGLSRQAVLFVARNPLYPSKLEVYLFQAVYPFNANFFSTLLLLTLHALAHCCMWHQSIARTVHVRVRNSHFLRILVP